jgi:hypothetical protein
MKGDDRSSGNVSSQRKRGRKPKRDIRTFHCLVAEVEAEVAKLMKENPKRKRKLVERAVANCLRHGNETEPCSWWWKDKMPLDLKSARQLYYDAKEALKTYELKHGTPYEPPPPLSKLGEQFGIKQEPAQTVEQMIARVLSHKRWLYEQEETMQATEFVTMARDYRRGELQVIAGLKRVANDMHTKLAKYAPKHPPEMVKQVRYVLAPFEAWILKFR